MFDPLAPAAPSAVGERLLARRYRLDHPLATGGMAEVWVAHDKVLGRRVAVKMLKPGLARDPVFVERFRREAVAAARLSHPSIVAVFDTVSEPEVEAVVMELVQGRTLRQALDEQGRLSVTDTVRIGSAVAAALDAAHRSGLVHRDVKPGNVLLSVEGRVLLSDFGIAKALSAASDLTSENIMLGTAKYLSPEQVTGATVDPRSDLYSLGVVLYECLAGRVPFEADTDAATALMRLRRDPPPLRSVRPGVPRVLDDLVLTTLAREPERRPASAAVFRDALARMGSTLHDETPGVATGGVAAVRRPTPSVLASPEPPDRTPTSGIARPQPHERRWALPAVTIVVLALVLGIAGVLLGTTGTGSRFISAVRDSVTGGDDVTTSETTVGDDVAVQPEVPDPGALLIDGSGVYDPPPGDGQEHTGDLRLAFDGNETTSWTTESYSSRELLTENGDKPGVGIVVRITGPADRHRMVITSPTRDWSARAYVSDSPHQDLDAWGEPVAEADGIDDDETTFELAGDGTYVLLLITDLGDGSVGRNRQVTITEMVIE